MKKNKLFLIVNILAILVIIGCEKEEDTSSNTKAVFSYVTDGFLVNFTNFSTNAAEYFWEFDNEGATSTQSNPVYVFPEKGIYLVSLTAKNGEETSTFIDTVRIIGPNIKVDGSFTDWEHVEYTHINPDSSGTLIAIKTFASANKLNFYLEGTPDMNLAVMNFYFDSDNNPASGHLSWMYPLGSGAEFMGEGNYNPADPNVSSGAVYKYGGPGGSDWTWSSVASFADAIIFSDFGENNGRKAVEFSIERDILGEMNEQINFGITESNSGWTQIGSLPVNQQPESAFIPFEL